MSFSASTCLTYTGTTITTTPYVFEIPPPYDTSSSYMLKVLDANNYTISGVENK